MALAEMQECLARLYTEPSYRRLFFLDPDALLADLPLTQAERSALATLDRDHVDAFANGLVDKSRDRFEAAYPLLAKAAPDLFVHHYARFHGRHPSQDEGSMASRRLAFGAMMARVLDADPALPLGDLARYELQILAARVAADPDRVTPATEITPESRPRLVPGASVETYATDMVALAKAIRTDAPRPPKEGLHILLAFRPRGERRAQVLSLNPAAHTLLALCDGTRTVATCVETVETALRQASLGEVVLGRLRQLASSGVIHV